jgi:CRISPR/Cas system type I-B associated protein Csh2 (Cas7 group RAMP superfamily)
VHIWIKKSNDNLPLAQPTSEEDIERLKKGTFYSFANNPSKLKSLSLNQSGEKYDNNWKEHPERLEGLLAAMAKTQIKHSLKEIDVDDCGVSKEQVREMVDRHGFTNVKEINAY